MIRGKEHCFHAGPHLQVRLGLFSIPKDLEALPIVPQFADEIPYHPVCAPLPDDIGEPVDPCPDRETVAVGAYQRLTGQLGGTVHRDRLHGGVVFGGGDDGRIAIDRGRGGENNLRNARSAHRLEDPAGGDNVLPYLRSGGHGALANVRICRQVIDPV